MLSDDAIAVYLFLSHWSYEAGLIRASELEDRFAILRALTEDDASNAWEFGDGTRDFEPGDEAVGEEGSCGDCDVLGLGGQTSDLMQLIPRVLSTKWVFIKGDPDNYPSVPHGHYETKGKPWPKLDPYTGRAFKAKDQEEDRLRLTKKEMADLWNDRTFRSFCLEHIAWYYEAYPYYRFRVENPRRLPRWRRR